MLIPTALGMLMLFHTLVREKKSPVDKSNRINHLRLVWFAMANEEDFVDLYPWLRKDEKDNLRK
jgi:hypothetical protein